MPKTTAATVPAPNPVPAGRTALDVIRARGEAPAVTGASEPAADPAGAALDGPSEGRRTGDGAGPVPTNTMSEGLPLCHHEWRRETPVSPTAKGPSEAWSVLPGSAPDESTAWSRGRPGSTVARPEAAFDVASARGWGRPNSPTASHDPTHATLAGLTTVEARDLPRAAPALREPPPTPHETEPGPEEPAASPRAFGLVVGAVCGLIGLWPTWRAAAPPAIWSLAAGVVLVTLALFRPALLAGPARLWHRLGLALGWLNTRILLGIAFLVLFVPLGVLRRLFGADPLQRAWDPAAPTYRTPARPREPGHVRRQS